MLRQTGLVAFEHSTGLRHVSREALRDLPGRFGYRGGITDDASEQDLLECFADELDRIAKRYPDTVLTSAHF